MNRKKNIIYLYAITIGDKMEYKFTLTHEWVLYIDNCNAKQTNKNWVVDSGCDIIYC